MRGKMLVKCLLMEDGTVRDCCILKGLPFMSEAVLAVVKTWMWTPGRIKGRPVKVDLVIPIQLEPAERSPPPATPP